jgi:hypothetical protein
MQQKRDAAAMSPSPPFTWRTFCDPLLFREANTGVIRQTWGAKTTQGVAKVAFPFALSDSSVCDPPHHLPVVWALRFWSQGQGKVNYLNVWEWKWHMSHKPNFWQSGKNSSKSFREFKKSSTLFMKPQFARLIFLNAVTVLFLC